MLARKDILNLVPAADINRNLGFQGALDIIGQTTPQQLGVLQQGNVQAQQQLLAGLPQIQNALLGRGVDLAALQPRALNVDSSFAQQKLPEFITTTAALNASQPTTGG